MSSNNSISTSSVADTAISAISVYDSELESLLTPRSNRVLAIDHGAGYTTVHGGSIVNGLLTDQGLLVDASQLMSTR